MELNLEEQVYRAIQNNTSTDKIVKMCDKFLDGGLHVCSLHKGTVLHLAIYHKKYELAQKLLDGLNLLHGNENNLSEKLTSVVDEWGHTLLHCAAVSDNGVEIANTLLSLAPNLLEKCNIRGETALFFSCRYGQSKMFDLLEDRVDLYCRQNSGSFDKDDFFHRIEDGMNVLHATINFRSFDLALKIAEKYPHLCKEQGPTGMTALQMLACCPTAFPSGSTPRLENIDKFFYTCALKEVHEGSIKAKAVCLLCTKLPCLEKMRQLRSKHMKALELLQALVKTDDTWKQTYCPRAPFDVSIIKTTSSYKLKQDDVPAPKDAVISRKITLYKDVIIEVEEQQNALLLAADKGCIEIVREILKAHPLAIEQFNAKRQTLLHLVIKNRHMDILEYIETNHRSSFEWMSRIIDDDGNSVLHMVGIFGTSETSVVIIVKNPFTQLSADLGFLEDLKGKCPESLSYHYNNNMQTADEMFASNSKGLQKEAKQWLDRTAQQGIAVAILIVTVVFAAIYQVPGGSDEDGVPHLIRDPFFHLFTNTDVLSLASALTSTVLFLFIYTSSVELDHFRSSLQWKLWISFTLIFISVSMMMVSFAATIVLVVKNQTPRTSNIVIYLVVCIPVAALVVSFIPLYIQLAMDSSIKWVRKKFTQLKQANDQEEPV